MQMWMFVSGDTLASRCYHLKLLHIALLPPVRALPPVDALLHLAACPSAADARCAAAKLALLHLALLPPVEAVLQTCAAAAC